MQLVKYFICLLFSISIYLYLSLLSKFLIAKLFLNSGWIKHWMVQVIFWSLEEKA